MMQLKAFKRLLVGTTAVVMLSATTSWAKHDRDEDYGHYRNHGQAVSAAAHNKSHGYDKTKHAVTRRDHRDSRRARTSEHSRRIRAAANSRDAEIRDAQRHYERSCRDILGSDRRDKRDKRDKVSKQQSRKLEAAQRRRDRAIREAQRKYNRTVDRIS